MRIEAEFLELPIPFGMGVAQTFDVDAARQAPFDSCLDQLRSQKRKRECQIDLPNGASLALVKAAVEGRLPRGINIERLRDRDPEWATQFKELGLNPN